MAYNELMEAAIDNVEVLIDHFIENDIVKAIPILGTTLKFIKAAGNIKDRIFAAKIAKFFESFDQISQDTREKLKEKITANPDEAKKVGEAIIFYIDRLAELNKARLLSIFFISYIYGHITFKDLSRIFQAIDLVVFDDLIKFLETHKVSEKSIEPHFRSLSLTGITPAYSEQHYKRNRYYILRGFPTGE
jgi:hypothetical protein